MATFTDAGKFAAHIGEYGVKIAQAEGKAVNAAALAATRDIRAEAKGFHIGKKKLGVGYTMTGKRAVIQARGPWGIVEKGTREHDVYPRRRRRRGKNRGALIVPGYGFFAKVHVKGAHPLGKPWEKGVAKAKVSGPKAFQQTVLKQVFH